MIDRIQVPVRVRVTPWGVPRVRPFGFAGPYASARLREFDKSTGSITSTTTHAILGSSDFGLTLGGGLNTRMGPGQLELQARYDLGLSDLGGSHLGNGMPRTGAVRVMTGYSF